MARRLFPLVDIILGVPSTGPRLGAAALLPHGTVIELFADEACTAVLDALSVDLAPATFVTVNGVTIPRFFGPDDNTIGTVYGRPAGATGDGFPMNAVDPMTLPTWATAASIDTNVQTKVDAKVPPAVTSALAADTTVKNAAASAAVTQVGVEVAKAGVVKGGSALTGDDSIAFSIVGSEGRRSWVEIGQDGRPTTTAAKLIAAALSGKLVDPGLAQTLVGESGYVYAITDASGRIAFAVQQDGQLAGRFPVVTSSPVENPTFTADTTLVGGKSQIRTHEKATGKTRIVTSGTSNKYGPRLTSDNLVIYQDDADGLAYYVPAAGGTVWPFLPVNRWAGWGDSLTAGGWPQSLSSMIGAPVDNWGIGGQISTQIAARQNGAPAALTLVGDQIPATVTPVSVTVGGNLLVRPTDSSAFVPGPGVHNAFKIVLAGVEGTIAVDDASNYTFTRTVAGAATPCPPGTLAYTVHGTQAQAHGLIVWAGNNDWNNSAQVVASNQAIKNYAKAYQKRVLFLGILISTDRGAIGTTDYNTCKATTVAMQNAFPGQVLDIQSYLASTASLTDNGLTPTANDLSDIANGWTPRQLRADQLHLTPTGYAAVASRIRTEMISRGWV